MNAKATSSAATTPRHIGPVEDDKQLDITVVLRHRTPPSAGVAAHAALSRADYAVQHGADPDDIARVRSFAQQHKLRETACQPERRTLHFSGTAADLRGAFGMQLAHYETSDGKRCVGCEAPPSLPDPSIIAVLGLDQRPVAKPHFRRPAAAPQATFTPPQLGSLYDFPPDTDGSGQSIAIIELGGGYTSSDMAQYFKQLGIATPSITAVSVGGAKNAPGSDADIEVVLDIQVAGALAPAAKIVVYFTSNTDQGFYNAIAQAAHDSAHAHSVISISWGGPEDQWSQQAIAALESALQDAASLGISVTVAAGDDGYTDGESGTTAHVDYPAASAYVLACGGTNLKASGNTISSEVVWNALSAGGGATGGGVSNKFPLPDWQAGVGVPKSSSTSGGRGVPDIAGVADPATGYQILMNGQTQVVGGTSAVAPLWAALLARLNQSLGHNLGDAHAALYKAGAKAFRDITTGDNGKFKASKGWDACTGLGSPRGTALLQALGGKTTSTHDN